MATQSPLPVSHARTSLSLLDDQSHVNLLGNVHGGAIMRLVDSTAGAVAQRHSGGPAVTAAMDEMAFLQPVHVGDIVRTKAQVNWAGRTSMEIGVRVESERWNEAGPDPTGPPAGPSRRDRGGSQRVGRRAVPGVTGVTGDTGASTAAVLKGHAHAPAATRAALR